VPWSAIPGDKPGTIVLEEFAIATVPHGPFLLDKLSEQEPHPASESARGVLVVGGVAYDDQPPTPGLWALALATAQRRDGAPVKPGGKLWPRLDGAKTEAEGLFAFASRKKLDPVLLSATDASTDRVLATLPKARIAHLATHGFFADPSFRSVLQVDSKLFERGRFGDPVGHGANSPMVLSGLVFAGANKPETRGRGLITGEALIDRNLSGLELAVLSACETGLGDVAGGEGVFGLQRAFHVAGTRNVVASLWKVSDDATAALMGEFYRRLWDDKNPLPPIEALRQAQLTVMRADPKDFKAMAMRSVGMGDVKDPNIPVVGPPMTSGKTNPPALWAAFTLSGPGR
jgi:CHAT domain-containing protein